MSLRERKLMDYRCGSFTILNHGGLVAAACGCYETVKDVYARAQGRRDLSHQHRRGPKGGRAPQDTNPCLVLLDILLPDANGFDVLNRIRHHPALEKIPVMLLTALGERKDVTRGLTLGADGYITKPVLPSVLLKAVEAAIGG